MANVNMGGDLGMHHHEDDNESDDSDDMPALEEAM